MPLQQRECFEALIHMAEKKIGSGKFTQHIRVFFWVAALSECRNAVDVASSEGGFRGPVACFVSLQFVESVQRAEVKTHQFVQARKYISNTSMKNKGGCWFPFPSIPPYFKTSVLFMEESVLCHAQCLYCKVHFALMQEQCLCPWYCKRNMCGTEHAQALGWCLSCICTMGSLRPRGLECHALVNFHYATVVLTLTDLMIRYVCFILAVDKNFPIQIQILPT